MKIFSKDFWIKPKVNLNKVKNESKYITFDDNIVFPYNINTNEYNNLNNFKLNENSVILNYNVESLGKNNLSEIIDSVEISIEKDIDNRYDTYIDYQYRPIYPNNYLIKIEIEVKTSEHLFKYFNFDIQGSIIDPFHSNRYNYYEREIKHFMARISSFGFYGYFNGCDILLSSSIKFSDKSLLDSILLSINKSFDNLIIDINELIHSLKLKKENDDIKYNKFLEVVNELSIISNDVDDVFLTIKDSCLESSKEIINSDLSIKFSFNVKDFYDGSFNLTKDTSDILFLLSEAEGRIKQLLPNSLIRIEIKTNLIIILIKSNLIPDNEIFIKGIHNTNYHNGYINSNYIYE